MTICRKSCSQCDYYLRRKSHKISIDRLYEEHGFEFASDDPTPEETYQQKELEEKVDEEIWNVMVRESIVRRDRSIRFVFNSGYEVLIKAEY